MSRTTQNRTHSIAHTICDCQAGNDFGQATHDIELMRSAAARPSIAARSRWAPKAGVNDNWAAATRHEVDDIGSTLPKASYAWKVA